MESSNRNVWIFVVAILALACCCSLVVAAAATSWFAARASDLGPFDLGGLYCEPTEETFEVSDAPTLDITNFAGSITVRPGESDVLHVVAVRKVSTRGKLDRIDVQMTEVDDRVVIRAKKLNNLSNASVDFEITAPANTRLDVHTGAGTVDVRGIDGRIDVYSGAGTIKARDVSGTASMALGAGEITYEGTPAGNCSFKTGAGNILLRVPADSNVEVDLGTGIGTIGVDFSVDGRVTMRAARGVIGDGSQGSIYAHTGVGNVTLDRQ